MQDVLMKILPILVIAVFGYILRILKVLKTEHGDVLLKLVYFVSLPALILTSVPYINLDAQFALLPISSALIITLIYFIASFFGRKLKLERKTLGVFLVGSMILNNGFMIPFIVAAYGAEGLGRLLIFDLSNGILAFTWVYYLACKHGDRNNDRKTMIKKFVF